MPHIKDGSYIGDKEPSNTKNKGQKITGQPDGSIIVECPDGKLNPVSPETIDTLFEKCFEDKQEQFDASKKVIMSEKSKRRKTVKDRINKIIEKLGDGN
jgi:hypothetical protein